MRRHTRDRTAASRCVPMYSSPTLRRSCSTVQVTRAHSAVADAVQAAAAAMFRELATHACATRMAPVHGTVRRRPTPPAVRAGSRCDLEVPVIEHACEAIRISDHRYHAVTKPIELR